MKTKGSRLEQVIKVKKLKENRAQTELTQIRSLREVENATLGALNKSKTSALDAAVRTMKARATDVQTSRAFIERLSRQILQQESRIEGIENREHEKREELIQKSQARKIVEKLDEKRKDILAKETERKEQRLLDVLSRRNGLTS